MKKVIDSKTVPKNAKTSKIRCELWQKWFGTIVVKKKKLLKSLSKLELLADRKHEMQERKQQLEEKTNLLSRAPFV